MTRDDVFRDLVSLIERSGRDVDTTKFVLDDEPFQTYGIDSLTLVRLIGDVERKFSIELKDSDAFAAFSFDRLVTLILERLGAETDGAEGTSPRCNFFDALQQRAAVAGDRAELRRRVAGQDDIALPHERLLRIAAFIAQGFPEPVDSRPQVVLVAAMDPLTTTVGFLAALSVEALPLVLPHPKALGGFEVYLKRVHRLVRQLGNRPVVALEPGLLPDRAALGGLPVIDLPVPAHTAMAPAVPFLPPLSSRRNGGDDVAFLQMTSASTGDAKLVAITHANICANLDAMTADLSMSVGGDRTCSWMPLYHDMGLIGGMLFPLYGGFSTILMRPNDFIKNPALWLRTLDEFRVTFTGAPNFAVDYAAMALSDAELEGVDLSCIRRFGLAAEPIHRTTVQRWLDRFGPYGFRGDAFVPGLGMAESTLSTTTRVGHEPRYVVVDTSGIAVGEPVRVLGGGVCTHPPQPAPEPPDGANGVAVFSLGTPLDGIKVHLSDEEGGPVAGEQRVGEICVVGTSVAGYYDPATGTQVPVTEGVLRSGDLGFFDSGELFVLERMKNVIIRNGVNHIASLLEQRTADVLGILAHGVLILEEDIHTPTSPVHVVIEAADYLQPLTVEQRAALRSLDLPIDIVTLVRGFSLPRTTSGKKRYHVCRQMLLGGDFDILQQIDLR
jgi:acyl-CoA synthetase (AMP-forming)/AMP-acid ligase II/acyl carrier protein